MTHVHAPHMTHACTHTHTPHPPHNILVAAHLCSRQSGHVDHPVCLEYLPSVGYPISQYQPPLSISVVDLHRLAGVEGVDIVRTSGVGTNSILSQTEHGVKVLLEPLEDDDVILREKTFTFWPDFTFMV